VIGRVYSYEWLVVQMIGGSVLSSPLLLVVVEVDC